MFREAATQSWKDVTPFIGKIPFIIFPVLYITHLSSRIYEALKVRKEKPLIINGQVVRLTDPDGIRHYRILHYDCTQKYNSDLDEMIQVSYDKE